MILVLGLGISLSIMVQSWGHFVANGRISVLFFLMTEQYVMEQLRYSLFIHSSFNKLLICFHCLHYCGLCLYKHRVTSHFLICKLCKFYLFGVQSWEWDSWVKQQVSFQFLAFCILTSQCLNQPTLPPAMEQGTFSPISMPAHILSRDLDVDQSHWNQVESQCGFYLYFSKSQGA